MRFKLRDFKDNGYSVTRTDKSSPRDKDYAMWLCQRRVRDPYTYKTKYFINVYISDIRLWGDSEVYKSVPNKRSLTIKLQFTTPFVTANIKPKGEGLNIYSDDITMNVDIFNGDWIRDVGDIDRYVAYVWGSLDGSYYDD